MKNLNQRRMVDNSAMHKTIVTVAVCLVTLGISSSSALGYYTGTGGTDCNSPMVDCLSSLSSAQVKKSADESTTITITTSFTYKAGNSVVTIITYSDRTSSTTTTTRTGDGTTTSTTTNTDTNGNHTTTTNKTGGSSGSGNNSGESSG